MAKKQINETAETAETVETVETVEVNAETATDATAPTDASITPPEVLEVNDAETDKIEVPEPEKKKRKPYTKKNKNTDSEDTVFDEIQQQLNNATSFDEVENQTATPLLTKEKRGRKGEKLEDKFVIEGYILLLLVDIVFPFALSMIVRIVAKKDVQMVDIQLDDKAMKRLEPLADACAKQLSVNMSPITGFFIVSALLYAQNVSIAIQKAKPIKKVVNVKRKQ